MSASHGSHGTLRTANTVDLLILYIATLVYSTDVGSHHRRTDGGKRSQVQGQLAVETGILVDLSVDARPAAGEDAEGVDGPACQSALT